jgi:hypothetical protein
MRPGTIISIFVIFFITSSFLHADYKRFFYIGKIDGKYEIYLDLKIEKDAVRGKYFYSSQSNFLWLDGKIDKNGKLELSESDQTGNASGSFTGMVSRDYSSIEGFWFSIDKKKKLPFKILKDADYKNIKHKKYNVSVEYPVFNINNKIEFKDIDLAIFKQAKEYYDSNLVNMESTINEVDDPKESRDLEFGSSLDVRYSDNTIKSLAVTHDEYTGGAHPNYYFTCFTYDKNGSSIHLNSVLQTDDNSIKTIDKLITDDLKKKDAEWVADGSHSSFEKELKDNEIPYLFSSRGIEFYFAPYIAGPYAQGSFIAIVSYTQIKSIIKPAAPIKYLIK